jgi:alkylation response protein AidB-like acyl-CoA dehydrogenase
MDRHECIRRAAELVPVLQQRAAQTEARRQVSEETIDDLCQAGLVQLLVPERYGGFGLDIDVVLSVAAELGRGCGSTAWCYSIWAAGPWLVGMYPERAQEEYWATGVNTLAAGVFNPAGTTALTAVEGGYPFLGAGTLPAGAIPPTGWWSSRWGQLVRSCCYFPVSTL